MGGESSRGGGHGPSPSGDTAAPTPSGPHAPCLRARALTRGGLWPWLRLRCFLAVHSLFSAPGLFSSTHKCPYLHAGPALRPAPPCPAPATALCPGLSPVRVPEISLLCQALGFLSTRPLSLFIPVIEALSPAGGAQAERDLGTRGSSPFPVSLPEVPACSKHPRQWLNTALAAHDGEAVLLAWRAGGRPRGCRGAGRSGWVVGGLALVCTARCGLLAGGSVLPGPQGT